MKKLSTRLGLTALATLFLGGSVAGQLSDERFRFTTTEKFDASQTTAYAGSHDAIYAYVDAHFEQHLANLQRWLRQPSVSAQNDGIQEMAEMLRADLEGLGFAETAVVPTDGHPGVWGYYDAGAERTLMLDVHHRK